MKIGCDACERAPAAVLCCADEAALCAACDAAVHSANRLAGKHHRVSLVLPGAGPSPCGADDGHPVCDICQEKTGYFFCLEDRALLCRSCDVAVHTAAAHVSTHRRFLITGVRIGDHVTGASNSAPAGSATNDLLAGGNGWSAAAATGLGGGDDTGEQQWPWSDIFAAVDDDAAAMGQCYPGLSEPAGSSSLTG